MSVELYIFTNISSLSVQGDGAFQPEASGLPISAPDDLRGVCAVAALHFCVHGLVSGSLRDAQVRQVLAHVLDSVLHGIRRIHPVAVVQEPARALPREAREGRIVRLGGKLGGTGAFRSGFWNLTDSTCDQVSHVCVDLPNQQLFIIWFSLGLYRYVLI